MISKPQIKFIKSLSLKKFRKEHRMFTAEGAKIVNELLASNVLIHKIYATPVWITQNQPKLNAHQQGCVVEISEHELLQISELTTPNQVVAIAYIPENKALLKQTLCLALDGIRDPGNLGTIIRLADWYGIHQIICSTDCTDAFGHKCVQASMGSIFRVNILYQSIEHVINQLNLPIFAATLQESISIHTLKNFQEGLLIIGSESHGISEDLLSQVHTKIKIPSFGEAESLNAAIATGILLDNLKRLSK